MASGWAATFLTVLATLRTVRRTLLAVRRRVFWSLATLRPALRTFLAVFRPALLTFRATFLALRRVVGMDVSLRNVRDHRPSREATRVVGTMGIREQVGGQEGAAVCACFSVAWHSARPKPSEASEVVTKYRTYRTPQRGRGVLAQSYSALAAFGFDSAGSLARHSFRYDHILPVIPA